MKVLLITQWYVPEPVKLLADLAETVRQQGHEITVLTGFPNYPTGKLYPGYKMKLWRREKLNGVPLIRVPLFASHDRSSCKRVLNYVSFSQSAAMLGPWLADKPDVIHVYHPPLTSAWPGWFLSRLWRVPFTYEIQDMWPETLQATGMVNHKRLLGLVGRFAKWVYGRAAAIRVISPGFRDNLIQKGVPAEKIRVISNWADTEIFRPLPPDRELARSLGLEDRFNVMFAGNIGFAQGCDTIIDAAQAVRDLDKVQFVFVGAGADLDRIQNLARDRALTNVKFIGSYPYEAMSGLYSLAERAALEFAGRSLVSDHNSAQDIMLYGVRQADIGRGCGRRGGGGRTGSRRFVMPAWKRRNDGPNRTPFCFHAAPGTARNGRQRPACGFGTIWKKSPGGQDDRDVRGGRGAASNVRRCLNAFFVRMQ